jgi:hypothetical protein
VFRDASFFPHPSGKNDLISLGGGISQFFLNILRIVLTLSRSGRLILPTAPVITRSTPGRLLENLKRYYDSLCRAFQSLKAWLRIGLGSDGIARGWGRFPIEQHVAFYKIGMDEISYLLTVSHQGSQFT